MFWLRNKKTIFWYALLTKVRKGAKIRNRYNQVALKPSIVVTNVLNSSYNSMPILSELCRYSGHDVELVHMIFCHFFHLVNFRHARGKLPSRR